jgi:hypothetical protein
MNTQDEIGDIVAELQRLQIQESQLLQRLERLNVLNSSNATVSPSTPGTPRAFVLGDLVTIKNPRPLQAKQGTIVKIGVGTDRITVLARNGTKIIRSSLNLRHVDIH